jgi:hypothetical protein
MENETMFIMVERDKEEIIGISTVTKNEIIVSIDFSDCYPFECYIYYLDEKDMQFKQVKIKAWHDSGDPLCIEVLDQNNNVLLSGYGTDH